MSDRIADLTRSIIGIENRTAQEAFDIMADRIRSALSTPTPPDEGLSASDERDLAEMVTAWRSSLANPASWMEKLRGLLRPAADEGEEARAREVLARHIRCPAQCDTNAVIAAMLAFRPSEGEGVRVRELEEAVAVMGEQFAFYAREHTAAGKHEKAATNQRFAEIAANVLARAALKGDQ